VTPVVATCPCPLSASITDPRARARRVTRDSGGTPSAPRSRGSSCRYSGMGGTTRADLPSPSVAIPPVRSQPWTVQVGVAIAGGAVPSGWAPLSGSVTGCLG
jgi:hypothetical protein